MFSSENDLFEIEENLVEFQEICSTLKNHTFPSPWKIFFRTPNEDRFTSEVSEFVVDDVSIVRDSNTVAPVIDVPIDILKEKQLVPPDLHVDKRKLCRLKESLMSVKDDSDIESIKDFDIFFSVSSFEVQLLFKMLDTSILNDSSINLILNAFLHFRDKISIATVTALVHHVISPLIFEKKNTSRFLLSTILKISEVFPKAVIDGILIPYSKKGDFQSDIVYEIAKGSLPNEYVPHTIKSILEEAVSIDNSFVLLQCLIERKVHLDSALCDLLLKTLSKWTSQCCKNVKFTKLITSILSAYGNELTEQQLLLCDEIVKSNKTIIKKAAENLLKQLKQDKNVYKVTVESHEENKHF